MGILDIPNEIFLLVGENLSVPNLYNFLSACGWLSSVLTAHLRSLIVQDEGGTGVLRWAVEHGHVPLAELSISVGADIHKAYDHEGGIIGHPCHKPLEWAALYGHSDVIHILFNHGASLDARDTIRKTSGPLHLAALHGRLGATRMLLELGADMTYTNFAGETPAYLAARGNVSCMEALVDAGFNLNTEGPDGRTFLHAAAEHTSKEMVEYLLGKKEVRMAINSQDDDERTPLHLAILNSEIVKLLLRHGADMEIQDKHGLTPAHRAACYRLPGIDPESLRVFIDAGFNLSTRTMFDQTVLHYAAETFDKQEAMEDLLKQPGVIINARDSNGVTPLAWAANRKPGPEREWMISLLVQYGANPEIPDFWGDTPAYKIRQGVLRRQYLWNISDGDYSCWNGEDHSFWYDSDDSVGWDW